MSIHPLVTQLRFTRSEFVRCLEGVPPEDACRRLGPMNCLSWIVGHLASQEHFLWVEMAQGQNIAPGLRQLVGFRQPASTPPWEEMWALWHTITDAADRYLDTIATEMLSVSVSRRGREIGGTGLSGSLKGAKTGLERHYNQKCQPRENGVHCTQPNQKQKEAGRCSVSQDRRIANGGGGQ